MTDFLPIKHSERLEDIRSRLRQIRAELDETGLSGRYEPVQGGLTLCISFLFARAEEARKLEREGES